MHPAEWVATQPPRLTALVGQSPTPVSAAGGWLDGVGGDPGVRAAGLWRIGTGTVTGMPGTRFPVAVPFLDNSHLQIVTTPETRRDAEDMVQTLLLRAVRAYLPGKVQLSVWDAAELAGSLPDLYPLTRTGLLTVRLPDQLGAFVGELAMRITRVKTRVLADGHPSAAAAAALTGRREEPWTVAVLLGDGSPLPEDARVVLEQVSRAALTCGLSLITVNVDVTLGGASERVTFTADGVTTQTTGKLVTVQPDPPPSRGDVIAACRRIVERHEALSSYVGPFRDLLPPPDRWGTASSLHGVTALVGFVDGEPAAVSLNDATPHALVGGPTGTGKTNLLMAMVGSLAARYPPSELEFFLLDFKEGVSSAQFALDDAGTWLPHAKLVGTNMAADPEFGLGLLRHLAGEIERRGRAARAVRATKLPQLRAKRPDVPWPRIVVVIDEFQRMFTGGMATAEAVQLLEDIARLGRAFGIHLVLASQQIDSIDAFWGRQALFEQFVARWALPRARGVLQYDDDALAAPKWSAVLNDEGGVVAANVLARIPNVSEEGILDPIQRWAHATYPTPPPRLFDGAEPPDMARLVAQVPAGTAVVGQRMNVDGGPAAVYLTAGTGRNLAVVGARHAAVVLEAAAESLAGHGKQVRLDLSPDAGATPEVVAAALAGLWEEIRARMRTAGGDPIYVVVRKADAISTYLDGDGLDMWRSVLRLGPELGVHVLGWWRSARRLKDLLMSGEIAQDDIGALVGVDVDGDSFGSLLDGPWLLSWAPRPGRALFLDRSSGGLDVITVPEEES
jgi:S-DNA-T family DNA segregation ATPase FtsK/SpoIIIE